MSEYDLAVIVVCSNDGAAIVETHNELSTVLVSLGLNIELVYVDNGSRDDTVYRLRNLEAPASTLKLKVVVLRRSFGSIAAFMAGVHNSESRFVLVVDPGLMIDPVEIVRIVDEIEQGYDLVVGWRQRQHLGWFVRSRSRVVNYFTSLMTGVPLHDYGSIFHLCRRSILDDLRLYGDIFPFLPVFAHLAGARIKEIPVKYRPDYYAGREYTAGSVFTSIFDLVTVWFFSRYAARPIQLFGSVGVLFILSSFVALILAFANREVRGVSLIQTPLPTLAGILFAVGVQTILLGLMTELLIRSYRELQDKPNYSVREVLEK